MFILGYDLHLIYFILGFFTIFMVFFNGLIECFEDQLPLFVLESFRYGKTLNGPVQTKLVRLIKVPKAWFLHFYIFSSIFSSCLLFLAYKVYLDEVATPVIVLESLDIVCTQSRSASCSRESIMLILVLLCCQCYRRFYECAFVNAKSNSSMNILHYIVGYAHYFCAGTASLCQAPQFVQSNEKKDKFEFSTLISVTNIVAVTLFIYAWYHQFRAHKIFADLKTRNPNKHGIPEGDLFSYVSCPHYLCEVLIYASLVMVTSVNNTSIMVVFLWVLVNQTVAAFMSHSWYKKQFKDYPNDRRAIYPYLL